MDDFSNRLRTALKKSGLTQSELCRRTKIDRGAMSSYLSNKYKPKQSKLYSLAQELNVSEAWLMGFDDVLDEKQQFTHSSKQYEFEELMKNEILFEIFENLKNLDDDKLRSISIIINELLKK